MTNRQITLFWPAVDIADSSTDYVIEADKNTANEFEEVITVDAAQGAHGLYNAALSTLSADITADTTTVTLLLGTENDFPVGTPFTVGRELMLPTDATDNVYAVTRGYGGTLPRPHSSGDIVYGAHMSYIDPNVAFGDRHVIRYRVRAVHGGNASDLREFLAYSPSLPPDNSMITIYGTVTKAEGGEPIEGMQVALDLGDADFAEGTGEMLYPEQELITTDESGYFELFAFKDSERGTDSPYTITIRRSANAVGDTRVFASIPDDVVMAHYLTLGTV